MFLFWQHSELVNLHSIFYMWPVNHLYAGKSRFPLQIRALVGVEWGCQPWMGGKKTILTAWLTAWTQFCNCFGTRNVQHAVPCFLHKHCTPSTGSVWQLWVCRGWSSLSTPVHRMFSRLLCNFKTITQVWTLSCMKCLFYKEMLRISTINMWLGYKTYPNIKAL